MESEENDEKTCLLFALLIEADSPGFLITFRIVSTFCVRKTENCGNWIAIVPSFIFCCRFFYLVYLLNAAVIVEYLPATSKCHVLQQRAKKRIKWSFLSPFSSFLTLSLPDDETSLSDLSRDSSIVCPQFSPSVTEGNFNVITLSALERDLILLLYFPLRSIL